MKNLILPILLVLITLAGCEKSEEETRQNNTEQISAAHYMALGALQSLGKSVENSTDANGGLTTFINLSQEWKAGKESNLCNQVGILMLSSGKLKFKGWTTSSSDNLTFSGVFVYENTKDNKSNIEIIFRLNPYVTFSVNTYIK
jgi:hypothetical protein